MAFHNSKIIIPVAASQPSLEDFTQLAYVLLSQPTFPSGHANPHFTRTLNFALALFLHVLNSILFSMLLLFPLIGNLCKNISKFFFSLLHFNYKNINSLHRTLFWDGKLVVLKHFYSITLGKMPNCFQRLSQLQL